MTEHPQTQITVDGDRTLLVDEALAPLIVALWDLGIETTNSCQGTEEDWRSAYIAMYASHFERFLTMFEDDIEFAHKGRALKVQAHAGQNFISCWHMNCRESFDAATYYADGSWRVNMALRFPPSAIASLTDAVVARAQTHDQRVLVIHPPYGYNGA